MELIWWSRNVWFIIKKQSCILHREYNSRSLYIAYIVRDKEVKLTYGYLVYLYQDNGVLQQHENDAVNRNNIGTTLSQEM